MSPSKKSDVSVQKPSHIRRFGLWYGFLLGKVTTLLVIFLLIWFTLLDAPMPWKVIDAADPRFDPMKFEYTDYSSRSEFKTAIKTLFPVGTDKSYVDKILVEVGGGTTEKFNYKHETLKDKITYRYSYNNVFRKLPVYIFPVPLPLPPFKQPSHFVSIDYDKDHKLKRIFVLSGFGLPTLFYKKSKLEKELENILEGY